MQNQNFTVALVDKNLNLFKKSALGLTTKVANIAEHESRLDEISTECHFFIDEYMFIALGFQGVPFKYTKVFVKDVTQYSSSKYTKIFPIEEFNDHVRKYNKFDDKKPLFLMGGSSFTKMAMRVSSKMLMTVVDIEETETSEDHHFERFPIDEATEIFTGRRKIEPVLLKDIKKYKRELKRKREQSFIISEGGAKVMVDPEPKFSTDILDSPDYMFYEYRRR